MSSKNISKNSLNLAFILISFLILAASSLFAQGEEALQTHQQPFIKVIYPKPGQTVTATDSTFILGHIGNIDKEWKASLFINGIPVKLYPENQFLAFVPIQPDSFVFNVELKVFTGRGWLFERGGRAFEVSGPHDSPNKQDTLNALKYAPSIVTHQLKVFIPPPVKKIPLDTMLIAGDYNGPKGDITLAAGDELSVSFVGTPSHQAWFTIPGVIDSVPMSETKPQNQTYWGEAVFGAGSVPDSLLVRGIYSGFWKVPHNARIDTSQIIYYIVPPTPWQILTLMYVSSFDSTTVKLAKYLKMKTLPIDSAKSSYRVTLNDPDYPFAVKIKDSVQIIRHGPVRGYQSIFQPKDLELLVVGAEKPWYKVRLSKNQFGWVHDSSVVKLGQGLRPPLSYLKTIRTKSNGRKLTLEFPLAGKHPFQVIEDDSDRLRLRLFGIISDTDWIRYDFTDSLIDIVTWSQPEEGLYEVTISLKGPLWGYDSYYKGNTFYLDLIKPPSNVNRIKDKIIVIDPGHSPDPGSIGPSGYTEAEANLAISLELKNKLESRGAKVIMTRMEAANIPLYERPIIAKMNNADLFVSIHNNALPDGVNPYTNNGTSTYYYHPHSIDLGRAVHKEMLKATTLPDHGFYHGNLAVNRPTQYPAVLVECAFMIIPEQEAMLKTKAFRTKVADAVTRGIENFLKGFGRE